MKISWTPVLCFAMALSATLFISNSHFANEQRENEKEGKALYGNEFDDPAEGGIYSFMRLRNPFTNEIPRGIRKNELAFAATLPKADNSRSITWQNRGPYNLGGRTRALALDVTDENTILAGQVSGGMWRSTNAGAWFTECTQPQQFHSTTCVVQDKRAGHTNVWYYGTGEQYGIVNAAGFSAQFSGDGIFKSIDGGVNWTPLLSTQSNTPTTLGGKRDFDFIWDLVTNHTNAFQDEVYAAAVNGIWRSVDGGTSWTPVLGLDTASALSISQFSDIAISASGVLYATISSETPSKGIWRSTDGITWTKITPTGFATSYRRIEIGIAPSDESQVYFIAETPGNGSTGHQLWHYQYISGDGTGTGGSWSNRSTNIPDDHCLGYFNFDFRKYNSQNSYNMFFVVHPTNPDIVFLGGTDIYRSTNGFTTAAYEWIGGYQCDSSKISNYVYPGHHPDQHKLIFPPSNTNKAYSGNDGGVMETNDILATPVVWQFMNNGYNTGQFYTCAIEPGNSTSEIIIGGLQDNGTYFTNTTDYTQDWPKTFYGDGSYCAITHGRSFYFLSIQQGKIYKHRVTDNGDVDTLFTRIDPTGGGGYQFINPLILDPFNDDVMYMAGGRTIWRNDSLSVIPMTGNEYSTISKGWSKLSGSSLGISSTAPYYTALDMSEANTNILYIGTDNGKVYRVDSCQTSNSSAKKNITGSNFPATGYISCIEVDRLNVANVMATFSNYGIKSIFYSADSGSTWTDVSGNLEENIDGSGNGPSLTWANIYNNGNSNKYYVGTSIGLFSTELLNGANTIWAQEGATTIGNVVINMIQSRTFDNTIVVATHGNGIYSNKIFTPSAVDKISSTALNATAYPNPFSNSVIVELNEESKTETEFEVFDYNGRLIRKWRDKNLSKTTWDGKDFSLNPVSSGSYLLKVTSNGKSTVKKLVKL